MKIIKIDNLKIIYKTEIYLKIYFKYVIVYILKYKLF